MFQVDEDNYDTLNNFVSQVNQSYLLEPFDKITVEVYTASGEVLIDPERKLMQTQGNANSPVVYLMDSVGNVKLPMIGYVNLIGLSTIKADSVLSKKYSEFYQDAFVITQCVNRRVTVLGALGGQVIELGNENMTLLEVLALSGGIEESGKSHNIRLIRGDLKDPEVYLIDLSTINGMTEANLNVLPGDIVYVEPVTKVLRESLADITPVFSLITSVVTLAVLLFRFSN